MIKPLKLMVVQRNMDRQVGLTRRMINVYFKMDGMLASDNGR